MTGRRGAGECRWRGASGSALWGHDTRTVQGLLRHADVRTTMIDAHELTKGGRGVTSPLDAG